MVQSQNIIYIVRDGVAQRVLLVEQELLTLPEHLSSRFSVGFVFLNFSFIGNVC